MSNVKSNEKEALNEFKKQFKACLRRAASDITFEIERYYEAIIAEFYKAYKPKYYKRTFSTYKASSAYKDKAAFQETGDGYIAGIVVRSNNIRGNPYRADKDWVFNRTFVEGIHGMTQGQYLELKKKQYGKKDRGFAFEHIEGYTKAPTLYRKIEVNAKSGYFKPIPGKELKEGEIRPNYLHNVYVDNKSYFDNLRKTYKNLKSGGKSRLNFRSKKPKVLMDKVFKEITKRSYIDSKIDSYIAPLGIQVGRRYFHGKKNEFYRSYNTAWYMNKLEKEDSDDKDVSKVIERIYSDRVIGRARPHSKESIKSFKKSMKETFKRQGFSDKFAEKKSNFSLNLLKYLQDEAFKIVGQEYSVAKEEEKEDDDTNRINANINFDMSKFDFTFDTLISNYIKNIWR